MRTLRFALAACFLGIAAAPAAAQGVDLVGDAFPIHEDSTIAVSRPQGAFGEDGGFVAVWWRAATNPGIVVARGFDADADARGEALRVSPRNFSDSPRQPDVARLSDGYLVVWLGGLPVLDPRPVLARRLDAAGRPVGDVVVVATGATSISQPRVLADGAGGALVLYDGGSDAAELSITTLRIAHLDADLTVFDDRRLDPDAANEAEVAAAVAPDGSLLAAWYEPDGSQELIRARLLAADGVPAAAVRLGSGRTPAVAYAGGAFLVTWWDENSHLRGRRVGLDGTALGDSFLLVNEPPDGQLGSHDLATDGAGGYLLAWEQLIFLPSFSGDVWVQRLDALARPVGAVVQVSAEPGSIHRYPSLAVGVDGRAVLLWNTESTTGVAGPILGRRLVVETLDRSPCFEDATTLCLGAGGRFAVTATWSTERGIGAGQSIPVSADTGGFWFFADDNLEILVKTLDGCPVNDRWWVFAAGLTNVAVEVMVRDTSSGQFHRYPNPLGMPFQPLQDTQAFATCP